MIKNSLTDTIAAISTPIGPGGIGIVRISGKESINIADKIFRSPQNTRPSGFKTYTTHYGRIYDAQRIVDEVILTLMRAPRSYTKEDVVEINCHGGIVALRDVLDLVLKNGARLAENGEFTKRAFLNGRIDLVQAEAVIDVINAKTDAALKSSLSQLSGALSKQINKNRGLLLDALTQIEANIDFPQEDIGEIDLKGVIFKIEKVLVEIRGLLEQSKYSKILREGLHAVICGRPNVGKSSLLNALLKEERSIVTPVAGTTRDAIEEIIEIKGIPVRIVDTAGILEPRDLVEKKAVQRAKRHILCADLVLLLFDGSKPLGIEDKLLISKLKNKNTVAIINKIDLKQKIDRGKIQNMFKYVIEISAKKLKNIGLLEKAIADLVFSGKVVPSESMVIANLRQRRVLAKAEKIIAETKISLDNNLSLEFIAQGLKESLDCFDEILGKKFSEDLLDRIFSDFCIGK